MILVWAIRLTGNWIYAFPGLHHEDWRYPLLKEKAGKAEALVDLFGIHVIPTLQVFLGLVPAYVALTVTGRGRRLARLPSPSWSASARPRCSFVADGQMYRFARTKQPGQAMDQGLWAWCAAPQLLRRVQLLVSPRASSASRPRRATGGCAFVGAVAMSAMFLGASIPMMEERSLERRPSYQDVIDRVPMFVPRPPRQRRPSA